MKLFKLYYTSYQINPQECDELRYDVMIGYTCLDSIVQDYYNYSTDIFDHINSFGAQAVFIAFPNPDNLEGNEILNLRHDIEDKIIGKILEPMGIGQVIGGATGTQNSYIDIIVYDFDAFVNALTPMLKQYPEISFYLSEFRQHSKPLKLTEGVKTRRSWLHRLLGKH